MTITQQFLGFFLFALLVVSVADGSLTSRESGAAYYDDSLDVTWAADANLPLTNDLGLIGINADGSMTWSKAQEWVASLNASRYLGRNDWRLPTASPVNGSSYQYGFVSDGSEDRGYNISAPGSVYPGSVASEHANLFYSTLANLGFDDVMGNSPQPGWGLQNTGPFTNLNGATAVFWSDTASTGLGANSVFTFNYYWGIQDAHDKESFAFFVWPVRDGDIDGAPVGVIDPGETGKKYAWSENAGWINFRPSIAKGYLPAVTSTELTGYAWSENTGWISLNCKNLSSCATVDYGVSNDGLGVLTGYAWAENTGWISFSCANTNLCAQAAYGVTVDPYTGEFSGQAWGENLGWVSFNSSTQHAGLLTEWRGAEPVAIEVTYAPPVGARNQTYYWDGLQASGGQPPYSYSVVAGGPLTWNLTLQAAPWDSSIGTIWGTPVSPTAGEQALTLQVTDANGSTATVETSMRVLWVSGYTCGDGCHGRSDF